METTLTTLDLWTESNSIKLSIQKSSPTSLLLQWTLPATYKAYAGAIVVISDKILDNYNFPSDGIRYQPSSDLSIPADTIGDAQVVAAFYSSFGDNISQTSIEVTNTDPSKIYYASIHPCTNILAYHKNGIKSYPIDGTFEVINVDNYTGNIPTLPSPPLNPSLGEVYYNPSTNAVQMWTGSSWINASTAPTITG